MRSYIYRRVDLRFWGDEKVRRLSRPAPNGRDLFLYLLTARESVIIPGVIPAGPATIGETLGWDPEAVRQTFRELSREGLAKADWDARLVWVPNAPRYNKPESPNVLKSWAKAWPGVPESYLKAEMWQGLRALVETLGEGFRKAFAEGFPEPSPQPYPEPSPNQDQDQDQDQEEDRAAPTAAPPDSVSSEKEKRPRKPSLAQAFVAWAEPERAKVTQSVDEIPRPVVLNEKLGPLIAEFGGERLRLGYLVFLRDPYAAKCNPPFPFGLFMSQAKRHVPRADQVAPAAGPVYRQHKAGDDPYADPPKKGGA